MSTASPEPSATVPGTGRRPARRHVVSVLGVVLVLVVCMVGFRLTEATRPYELRTARLDQWASFQTGEVRVGDVQVAEQVQQDDSVATTPGLFVAMVITVRATGGETVDVDTVQLVTGTRTYDPFQSTFGARAGAGHEHSEPVLFEVDPDDVPQLAVQYSDRGVVYRYYTTVEVRLDLSDDRATAARGTGLTLPESTDRLLP